MPLGDTESRLTQMPSSTDAKQHVGDGLYYTSKEAIVDLYKYVGMTVTETINGVTNKYTWDGNEWISTDDIFTNSTPTTNAIGGLAANQNLQGRSIINILSSMLYTTSISGLTIGYLTNQTTEHKVSYGSAILNKTDMPFTATLQVLSGFDFMIKDFRLKTVYNQNPPLTIPIKQWSLNGNIATGTIDINLGSARPYDGSLEFRILKAGTNTYYTRISSIRYLPPIYYFKLNATSLTSSNYLDNSGRISKTKLDAGATVNKKTLQTNSLGNYLFASGVGYVYFLIPVLSWENPSINKYGYNNMRLTDNQMNFSVNTAIETNMIFDNEGTNTVELPYLIVRSINSLAGEINVTIS